LFGRFQRLSAKPTAGETSTGLGLSIVKRIVDLHGGQITVESAGPGKGATFKMVLPVT
jgi:signal transduction histidine kinase